MATREKLEQEILRLTLIIESNQAALRLRTISQADKAHLVLALGQRKARLALLQEELAALARPD
jgi:hypothetical protein